MQTDELDLEIMKILQSDGRKSFREIAAILKKPESTIRSRYNQLIDNKVLRIVAIPDPKEVGFGTMAIIGLKMDLSYLEEAAESIAKFKEVRYITCVSGKYDLIIEVYAKTNDELIHFMTQSLPAIKGIKESELNIELKLFKDTYEWLSENS